MTNVGILHETDAIRTCYGDGTRAKLSPSVGVVTKEKISVKTPL